MFGPNMLSILIVFQDMKCASPKMFDSVVCSGKLREQVQDRRGERRDLGGGAFEAAAGRASGKISLGDRAGHHVAGAERHHPASDLGSFAPLIAQIVSQWLD